MKYETRMLQYMWKKYFCLSNLVISLILTNGWTFFAIRSAFVICEIRNTHSKLSPTKLLIIGHLNCLPMYVLFLAFVVYLFFHFIRWWFARSKRRNQWEVLLRYLWYGCERQLFMLWPCLPMCAFWWKWLGCWRHGRQLYIRMSTMVCAVCLNLQIFYHLK